MKGKGRTKGRKTKKRQQKPTKTQQRNRKKKCFYHQIVAISSIESLKKWIYFIFEILIGFKLIILLFLLCDILYHPLYS